MNADELGTLAQCAAYCKIDAEDAQGMLVLDMLRDGVADGIASYCKKTEGFKPATKLEFLKLMQKEWTTYMQGAHGIASENAGNISTTYRDSWPADTLAVLDRDRKVVVK